MTVTLPGDVLSLPSSPSGSASTSIHKASASSAIKLGPGLLWPSRSAKEDTDDGNKSLLVTKSGIVGAINVSSNSESSSSKKGKQGWWIENVGGGGSYTPSPSDAVIGQITAKNAEFYTLSISSCHSATLSTLAFEGATKRHKPNLKLGALVYAMVIPASVDAAADTEPELTCVDLTTGKSNGMGEIDTKEGYCGVIDVSLNMAKSLLHPTHTLLQTLSSSFAFESAIGLNGLVWLRVTEPAHFLAAKVVLTEADSRWLGQSGVENDATQSQLNSLGALLGATEKRPGDAGKKMSSQWGSLDEKDVRSIVQKVLE
ncbi:unnamed protein product [Sympodiomycopsis kandeliae]